jgi:hypothetical protein
VGESHYQGEAEKLRVRPLVIAGCCDEREPVVGQRCVKDCCH